MNGLHPADRAFAAVKRVHDLPLRLELTNALVAWEKHRNARDRFQFWMGVVLGAAAALLIRILAVA